MPRKIITLTGPNFTTQTWREDQRADALKAYTSHYDGCAVFDREALRKTEHAFIESQVDKLVYDEGTYTSGRAGRVWTLDVITIPDHPPVL